MMDISHHHRTTVTRSSFLCLIAFALTSMALLASALSTPVGSAAWESNPSFSPPLGPVPLGNYPNVTVQLGANTTVAPDAAPSPNTTSINVSTSTNFKGKLEGNPTSGFVRITDAQPAGIYTVTVTGFDGGPATKTFTLTVTTPPTCSPVTFAAAANLTVVSPVSVAVGDFNGDGKQDLATANADTNDITVLYGNGAGSFVVGPSVSAGSNPRSIAVGDFNGDGRQDLATANRSSNNVAILLGNANGGFNNATNFGVGSGPIAVAVGDFNNDSKPDLAVANFSSVTVSILLGDGGGGFAVVNNFGVGSNPRSVAIGDFNGDGNQDLATANQMPSSLSVLLGNGAGGFGAAIDFGAGMPPESAPESVVVGDFNGDGNQDLATANFSPNVSVLLGNGAGSFSGATNFDAGKNPSSVAVGDFNGDGKQDLAVANFTGAVSVLLGNGAGSFSAATNFGTAAHSNSVAVGDFNGDGMQDLATANTDSNNVSVLLRQCPLPTLGNYPNTAVQLSANAVITPDAAPSITFGMDVSTSTDFKGKLEGSPTTGVVRITDAHPAGTYTVTVKALSGTGGGVTKTFTLTVTTPLSTCNPVSFAAPVNFGVPNSPNSVAVADFNGDGKQDLATANQSSNNVSVLLGDGAGGFGAASNFGVGTVPRSVAVGDFNGDGKQDIAAANVSSNNVSILLGNGAGSFAAATNFGVGSGPISVAIGDFNGDGHQDLAAANQSSNNVSILLGNGAGSFAPATHFGGGSSPQSVALGDFNGDGNQDLAVASQGSNSVSILLGNGAGNFANATTFGTGNAPYSVAIGDFNGDGKQDLAAAFIGAPNRVSVLLGDGAGGFGAATNFSANSIPRSVAVGDFNGDGKQDLAVANQVSSDVSILLGDGAGGFGAATNFGVGTGPFSVAVGDFDTDGKQDLAVANVNTSNVSVLMRQCPPPTVMVVGNTNDSGPGSLRQAILDANSAGTLDTITFNLPGSGVRTITLLSPLNITQPVIIDGYTQPGANANTLAVGNNAILLIEFTGNGGNFSGLNITGGSSTVRGLVINSFGESGIRLSGNGGSAVEGCFIGTDSIAMNPRGNGVGVSVVSSPSNNIGGATPAARNIISGNRTAGIQLGDVGKPATLDNSIRGNYIGTNATGNGPLGNGLNNPGGGNGIFIPANATGASIQANRIAYNTGNGSSETGSGVRIPTPAGGETPGTQIEITENEIFGNTGLGIDLGPAGITPNDDGDPDAGPNFLQNFPTLLSFNAMNGSGGVSAKNEWLDLKASTVSLTAPTNFTVVSQLNSTPNSTFAVHWYFSADAHCTTNQAATVPLDFGRVAGVMTNCNGFASFSFHFGFKPGITSGIINATATDQQGNTSEFSACIPVTSAPPWQPAVLLPEHIDQIKAWSVGGKTYVYVKLKFPDAGYRIASWGSLSRTGNKFTVDAGVERFTGSAIQSVVTTAHIYDLDTLAPADYSFDFKNSGTVVKSLGFSVGGPVVANDIDDAGKFVRRQYLDFLSREPDVPGLNHWTAEITKCSDPGNRFVGETEPQCVERKRANTSAAFFVSPEFQNTGYFVLRVYRGSLGRMPFFGGSGDNARDEFTRDAATVSTGIVASNQLDPAVINANKQAFVRDFVTRAEFRDIYDHLCNAQYVDKLFETTGIRPAANERQLLIDELDSGAANARANVLFQIVDGTTTTTGGSLTFGTPYGRAFYDQQFNPAFVQMEYFGYLRRDPDPDGFVFWSGKLSQFGNWNEAQMVLAFISSPEYRARFGQP